jgi:hypothetical protein
MANLAEIKKQLSREGYDNRAVDGGPSLSSQLRELIKESRSGRPAQVAGQARSPG